MRALLGSDGFRKYFQNTSWLFVDRVVRLGVVLLTGIIVTRYLGDEQFGKLSYASALVGMFFVLTTMGLNEIMVRDLVRNPERRPVLMGTAAMIKLCGAALLMTTVLVFSLVKGLDNYTITMVMIIAASELFKPMMVVEYDFLSQVRAREVAKVNVVQTLAGAAFKLVLVWMKAPLIWFAWAYVVENFFYALGFYVAYRMDGHHLRNWRSQGKVARELLGQSWPLVVYGVALYIQAKIDQVMIFDRLKLTIGADAANAEVGQYSVALKMIEAMGFLPIIVQASLAPAITRAKQMSQELYADRLVNQYRLMFLLFLVSAVPLYFLAEWGIVLLYGEKFRMAGHLLGLFSIRLFFTNMGMGKASFITNEGLFRYSLITAVIGATVNITMNYFLIPTYQSYGAIMATVGSFFVSIFVVDLFMPETRANLRWMVKGIFTFWRFHRAA